MKKIKDFPVFKIRCSAIGKIMSNPREKGRSLSRTAENYCDQWMKEQLYHRTYEFSAKYTEKGCRMGEKAADFIAGQLGYNGLIRNNKSFENDFMTGTPDLLPADSDLVIHTVSSWSWRTFPLFEMQIPSKDYEWQLQGYMELTGRREALLAYVLSDTPPSLIKQEAENYCCRNGYPDPDMPVYERFEKEMTYADVPDELKLKAFLFNKDKMKIGRICSRVMECRGYIEHKLKKL
ncbi:MAG: hypothetical protein LUG18_07365 [Candidatus Azobacteroides sp.]|nr:hypothetical protein [Candidatus Azobacteroides sp.]